MLGSMAISLLWTLIYIIIFAGVVWLVIYGIKTFVTQIPPLLERGIWFIVLLLVIIAVLTIFVGGGSGVSAPNPFHLQR
jgi:hypothetical protein